MGLLVCRDTLEDRLAFSFGFEFLGLHFASALAESLCLAPLATLAFF